MVGSVRDIPGVHYTTHPLPAVASGGNTAYEAVCVNPFEGSAYIESIEIIAIEDYTGDATNSQNFNADLVAGTEIANKDLGAGVNLTKGVAAALTFTGTAAQRTIAQGGAILIEREEVGTNPARIFGSVVRVGWSGRY